MGQRRGRNSVPAVNPNPRPPNEPRMPKLGQAQPVQSRVGVGNAQPVSRPKQQAQSGNTSTGNSASPAPSPPPAAAPQLAPPTDPRDARYWQDLAQLEFNKNIGEQKLTTEDTFDKSRYTREKGNLDYLAPIEVQRLRENANTAGAIYSTSTQEGLGNLAQEQFQRSAGLGEAFQQALAMRALSKNEIEGNYNLGRSNLGLEATERTAAAEAERAAAVAPTSESSPGASVPTASAAQKQALKARIGKKKVQLGQARKA